jgi:hypothetical protein
MSRLAAAGELLRVHHGLYWKGVQTRFGAGRPGLVDVAIAVAGPDGAGPSGWSAAQAHLEMAARREHSPALRRKLAAVREQLPETVLT